MHRNFTYKEFYVNVILMRSSTDNLSIEKKMPMIFFFRFDQNFKKSSNKNGSKH